MIKTNDNKGFSLIELLIVVAIIGIIAGITYPSYLSYTEKSRRRDAQSALMGLSAAMERLYTSCNSYASAKVGSGTDDKCSDDYIFPNQAPLDGNAKYYNLAIDAQTATTYTVKAVPIAGGVQAGNGCLALFSTGERCWFEGDDSACSSLSDCSGGSDWK
mgnify:CR=1 FL=1